MSKNLLDAEGKKHRNFLVTKHIDLSELQCTLTELIHEPTGARVMHIGNDDPENLFCLSFQTLPTSSNGVAHILEHTVLCGSKKYPVKDPFFAMTRRSLHTFMNALTGQDFTCYPASSQVEKDFYNLLEVYLDAAFHPQIKKMSFLQEGHRLEFSEPSNIESPLQYQGIVYNEMKGAMSDPGSRLWQEIAKHLLPDLPYCHNSGGDPKHIPELSYEELVEFHETFYHPSRCIFFFYGNFPLGKHLDFIEHNALKGVEKLDPIPPLKSQVRFKAPIHASASYPSESREQKTIFAFSWLTAPLFASSDVLALCLIESVLLDTDASPLKKALLQSNLCKEVESSIDVEMSEVPLMITCLGCEEKNGEKLKKILFDTLQKPLDPNLIEASLHGLEFERSEIGGEGGPFGLTLFMRSVLIKQHGNQAEEGLLIHSLFEELRNRLKDPEYLPSLIQKYLIDNPHFVCQTLIPDPELDKKEKEDEEKRLKKIQDHLTLEQKKEIVRQSEQLLKLQEENEHQSIDCLPKVTLSDIPKATRDFPLKHISTENLEIYHHECFTNHIIYADFLFDLPQIDAKDLPLLSLLTQIWTDLGCNGKSYEQMLQFASANTGSFDSHLAPHVSTQDPNKMSPAISFRGSALARKGENFFHLLSEFAKGPNFTDKVRIKQWLMQHASELENELPSVAAQYAIELALSDKCIPSFVYNQWHGLPYYHFIQNLSKKKNDSWISDLEALCKKLCLGKPELILSCGPDEMKELTKSNFYALGHWKAQKPGPAWKSNYSLPTVPSQARIISTPVAFTATGLRTCAYRDEGAAEIMLASRLMKSVILHKEIREKGGAYGGTASYIPTTGNFHFLAYRDPNLSNTLAAFKKSIEVIGAEEFSERELEEAKVSLIAAMDTPVVPGGRGIVSYAWLRAGRTLEERQRFREQILATTKEQIGKAVLKHIANAPATTVSLLGEQLWKKEEKKVNLQLIKE